MINAPLSISFPKTSFEPVKNSYLLLRNAFYCFCIMNDSTKCVKIYPLVLMMAEISNRVCMCVIGNIQCKFSGFLIVK